MALAMKVDVLPGPVTVGFGGAWAELATLAGDSDAVEKPGRLIVAGVVVTP